MRFEDWLAKSETQKVEKVEVVETQPSINEKVIVEAKTEKEYIPYEGENHDMQDVLDMYKKTNPRLHASILSWD